MARKNTNGAGGGFFSFANSGPPNRKGELAPEASCWYQCAMGSLAELRLPEIRDRVKTGSTLPAEKTDRLLRARFDAIPNRLACALDRWPLARSRVLDVGCSVGHCLVHFGPGSLGVDNVAEQVEFCRSIGLNAVQLDADEALDGVPDGAFDYVWVSDILEHLDAPRLLLRRLAPKLTPDGVLLVYMTTRPRSRMVRRVLARRGVISFQAGTHYYQFTLETARYLVERAGYAVTGVSVPVLRGGLRRLTPFVAGQAPTIIIEARPDRDARVALMGAERKNKPPSEIVSDH